MENLEDLAGESVQAAMQRDFTAYQARAESGIDLYEFIERGYQD